MPTAPHWIGFWEQQGYGRQEMRGLELTFQNGEIDGRGTDIVGPFVFAGKYDTSGAVVMVKQYVGRHQVLYKGWYDGEGHLTGEWSIGDFRGRFQFRLARGSRSEDDIQTLS